MRVFYTANGVYNYCKEYRQNVGFVPTMGALHDGHLELVRTAKSQKKVVVVSVFVNPKQFNNPEDLKKYPRTISNDLRLLSETGVDAVFVPSVSEIYPELNNIKSNFQSNESILKGIDGIWEGEFRPGHFSGVVDVVRQLFEIVQPNSVYFGEKDLQQCLVIHRLIQQEFPQIQMNYVPTKRENSGLAMSSRNLRLSENALIQASQIFKELTFIKEQIHSEWNNRLLSNLNDPQNEKLEIKDFAHLNITQVWIEKSKSRLSQVGISCEYLNLILLPSMIEINDFKYLTGNDIEKPIKLAIIFSGYLEEVRLIDNLTFELN